MGDLDRVRWHCRRGLLELDLILGRFMDRYYDSLDEEGRSSFRELLMRPDTDLLDWALGRSEPGEKRYQQVVELLRTA